MPTGSALREVLAAVTRRSVTVAASEPLATDADTPSVLADYTLAGGRLAVCCVADSGLADALGGAVESWDEIANQLARLLNSPDTPALRVRAVTRLPGELPDDVASLLREPRARRSFDVAVDELGRGTLSLVMA